MIPDPGLIAGVAGCLAALFSLLAVRRCHLRASRDTGRLSLELERGQAFLAGQQALFSEELAGLRHALSTLELSMQNTDEILRDGRMNRTSRAQAMRLLRSGVSPDTAAATLGVARREIKLLATVSQLLAAG
jgi:hypothetical protein